MISKKLEDIQTIDCAGMEGKELSRLMVNHIFPDKYNYSTKTLYPSNECY